MTDAIRRVSRAVALNICWSQTYTGMLGRNTTNAYGLHRTIKEKLRPALSMQDTKFTMFQSKDLSTIFRSLEKRFTIRPTLVDSKYVIGDLSTDHNVDECTRAESSNDANIRSCEFNEWLSYDNMS